MKPDGKTEADLRGEAKAAMAAFLERLSGSLEANSFIGAPKPNWEPSQEVWDHVYEMTKQWMSACSSASKRCVHRDKHGKPLTAADITEMFFRSQRTGVEEEIFTTMTPKHELNYIKVTLTLPKEDENADGE